MSGTLLARASRAAAPAEDVKSPAPVEMYSTALLDPALNSQVILTPSSLNSSSSQPFFLSTRLTGLYVA